MIDTQQNVSASNIELPIFAQNWLKNNPNVHTDTDTPGQTRATYQGTLNISAAINEIAAKLNLTGIIDSEIRVENPTFLVKEINNSIYYELSLLNITSEQIISQLGELIDIDTDFLEKLVNNTGSVNLVLASNGITASLNNLTLNLNEITSTDGSLVFIEDIVNNIAETLIGDSDPNQEGIQLSLSPSKLSVIQPNNKTNLINISAFLNNAEVALNVRNKTTQFIYKLPQGKDIDFSSLVDGVPLFEDFKLKDSKLIIANDTSPFSDDKLGNIDLTEGFNFIGNVDFANNPTYVSKFISEQLGINTLGVHIGIGLESNTVGLTGVILGNVPLFSSGSFNAKFNKASLNLTSQPLLGDVSAGIKGTITLEGYDPFKTNEPALELSGNLTLDPKSLSGSFTMDANSVWNNPFNLPDVKVKNLAILFGGTYLPPFIDNVGFVGDFEFANINLKGAFFVDTNDPRKNALELTVREQVSLLDLWLQLSLGPVASYGLSVAASPNNLVGDALEFLNKVIDIKAVSIDGPDADTELDPLIKFVPNISTKIANITLDQGIGINAKVTAWGKDAIVTINSNPFATLPTLRGSLSLSQIDLGFLQISGYNDPNLDLALEVSSTEQYLKGDGKLKIFGQDVAKADFKVTPTSIDINQFNWNLFGLVELSIDKFKVNINTNNLAQSTLEGSSRVKLLGQELAAGSIEIKDGKLVITTSLGVNAGDFGRLQTSLSLFIGSDLNSSGASLGFQAFGQSITLSASLNDLADIPSLVINGVADAIGGLPKYVLSAITDPAATLTNLTTYIYTSELFNKAVSYVKDLLGLKSDPVTFQGTDANDTKAGNDNDDVLFGNGGNDSIHGGWGNDLIDGGNGNDTLTGGNDKDIIFGGNGDDKIYGQNHNDELYGGDGNDYINGDGDSSGNTLGGNDYIDGGTGNDMLHGGDGNDSLYGRAGNDSLYGGANNDSLYGGSGDDTLDGGTGNDMLYGGDGNDSLYGGANYDDTLDGGNGIDTADYSYSTSGITADLSLQAIRLTGSNEVDKLISIENIIGSSSNDTLIGDSGNNSLKGGDGDDILKGGLGNDTLDGGSGNDTADYSYPILRGITADLSIQSVSFTDSLERGQLISIENIIGSLGNDILVGNSGNNSLKGGKGDDILKGGLGNDTLDGGSGNDTADYSYSIRGTTANLSIQSVSFADSLEKDQLISIENIIGSSGNDTLVGDSTYNDLDGGAGNDTLDGGDGSDILNGGAGNDTLNGGNGNDTADYSYSTGGIIANLTTGVEVVTFKPIGFDVSNTFNADGIVNRNNGVTDTAQTGIDKINNNLITQSFAATTVGGIGLADDGLFAANSFHPEIQLQYRNTDNGNNLRLIKTTTDSFNFQVEEKTYSEVHIAALSTEGSSNIRLKFTYSDGTTALTDAAIVPDWFEEITETTSRYYLLDGMDRANSTGTIETVKDPALFGLRFVNPNALKTVTNISVEKTGDAGYLSFFGATGITNERDQLISIENIIGSSGNDTLIGNGFNNGLTGGAGNDTLDGGDGNDTLDGGDGNDTLDGGDGNDTADYKYNISGITADLSIRSVSFTDSLERDQLISIENIIGSSGNDTLIGNGLNNGLTGGAGNDTLDGGDGNDTLNGGAGNDILNGGDGNDTLNGGGGNDILNGGGGDDSLMALVGNNTLNGGDGNDTADYFLSTLYSFVGITADLLKGIVTFNGLKNSLNVSNTFNTDGIVNRNYGLTDPTQNEIDKINNTLITQSFAATTVGGIGLPDNGLFAANSFHPEIQLQYKNADYGNNLRLIKTTTGSFNFQVEENTYSEVHIAALSTEGSSNIRLKFTYSDGTTALTDAATVPDWFNEITENSSLYYLMDGMDRANSTGTIETVKDPALFGLRFVNPNALKTVTYISVEKTGDTGYLSFFGATGIRNDTHQLISIENLEGGAWSDNLYGDDGNNFIKGNSGDDTIDSRGGNDYLDGGRGNDYLDGGDGNDTLNGGDDNDTADYSYSTGGIIANLTTGVVTFKPIGFDVSNIFNTDGIVNRNNGVTDTTQNGIDKINNNLITQSFAATTVGGIGLPDDGLFTANSFHTEIQLQYRNADNGNNLRLIKTTTDSFNFQVEEKTYSEVHIAALSTEGSSNIRLKFTYSDGTTALTDAAIVPDWFEEITETTSRYYLLDGMDRANSTGTFQTAKDPALFGLRFVNPNALKTVTNISVEKTGGTGYLSFFGATGITNESDQLISIENIIGSSGNDILVGDNGNNQLNGGLGNDTADYSYSTRGITANLTTGVVSFKDIGFDVSNTFNADGIVNRNNGVTDTAQNGIDINNNTLITQSFAATTVGGIGLPDNGLFAANSFHPDIQLQYRNTDNGNNLRLIKTTTESFNFQVQENTYSEVHIAALSTEGSSNIRLKFTYSDSTTALTDAVTVPDWFNEITQTTSLYYLLDGMDRANSTGTFQTAKDPALFGLRFVNPNAVKTVTNISVEKTGGTGYLSFFGATGITNESDQLFAIENLIGSSGNDTLTGNSGNNQLTGGAGNDKLYGHEGNDTLSGGLGDDELHGSLGADTLDGGDGNDTLYGQQDNDILNGGAGDDILYGEGNGSPAGSTSNDTLNGGSGNDTLDGGVGNDVLNGGDGNDTLDGGDGNDTLYGGVDNDKLYGNEGNDTLSGGLGDDELHGWLGADTLDGGDGNDTLYGQQDNDILNGGAGDDILYGEGNGSPTGSSSNDTLNGGSGNDTLYGGAGVDYLYGESGDDKVFGEAGIDMLNGGSGNDTLDGGDGDDDIQGWNDNDLLIGGLGNDILNGMLGNDTLIGGLGNDTLSGGTGADNFRFDKSNEGIDRIKDFNRLEGDKILISAATFGTGVTLQQFTFNYSTQFLFFNSQQIAIVENVTSSNFAVNQDITLV